MYRSPNLREKFLDGEKLFRKYYEWGESERSIKLLTEWAISQGMTSSTGEAPSEMGVWKAMWRWASLKQNRDLAFKIYKSLGGSWTWDLWKLGMLQTIKTAWQFNTDAKYQRFLRNNGWS